MYFMFLRTFLFKLIRPRFQFSLLLDDHIINIFDSFESLPQSLIFLILFFFLLQKFVDVDVLAENCLYHFNFISETILLVIDLLFE